MAERRRELNECRDQLTARLDELKSPKTIPLHFFKEDSIAAFQSTIKELFLGDGSRDMTKRYLKLFIERIDVDLPRVQIVGRTEAILTTFENKTAVRTDGVLTAEGSWLPLVDALRNQFAVPSQKMMETVMVAENQLKDGFLAFQW